MYSYVRLAASTASLDASQYHAYDVNKWWSSIGIARGPQRGPTKRYTERSSSLCFCAARSLRARAAPPVSFVLNVSINYLY